MAIASAAGLATGSAFAPRYAAVFFPFFALLVALGLDHFRGSVTRNVVLATFLVLSCVGLVVAFRLTRTQSELAAEAIARAGGGPALVITCPDQLGPSVRRAIPDDIDVTTYPRFADPELVDWVDYADRNARNDPAAFADEALARAGSRPIYVVLSNSYLTVGTQCTDALNAMGAQRPIKLLMDAKPDDYFESMAVYELPPK
jgi:hypothetical protein